MSTELNPVAPLNNLDPLPGTVWQGDAAAAMAGVGRLAEIEARRGNGYQPLIIPIEPPREQRFARLPEPYGDQPFTVMRRGVHDDPSLSVFIDKARTFACLDPVPTVNYEQYVPRSRALKLEGYKAAHNPMLRRWARIGDAFPRGGRILEIGASDGGFLRMLRAARPELQLFAVEPDQITRPSRDALGLGGDYASLAEAEAAGEKFDIICFFHVFEHIAKPRPFLDQLGRMLAPGGRIVIEVPSLSDPLLALYRSEAYARFYFQRQHPYVYSAVSLQAVLMASGWSVGEVRPYQRYGLANHLAWLADGKPGGNETIGAITGPMEDAYRAQLEAAGTTDTVFAVASR